METNTISAISNSGVVNVIDALRAIGLQEVATNVFSIPTPKKKK